MADARQSQTCGRCGRSTAPRGGRVPRFCAVCGQPLGDAGRPAAAFAPTPPAATAALLLGLFSLIPLVGVVFALLAIPLGLTAVRQIDASQGRYTGRGIALAGALLGGMSAVLWTVVCCGGWHGL